MKLDKRTKTVLGAVVVLLIMVIAVFLFLTADKGGLSVTGGDDLFMVSATHRGGGGSSGGGSANPDTICPDCEVVWVETLPFLKVLPVTIGVGIDNQGLRKPAGLEINPGHWECRGGCADSRKVCKALPILTPEGKPVCECVLNDPCHLSFGDLFCDRAVPQEYLKEYIMGDITKLDNHLDSMGLLNMHELSEYIDTQCGIIQCEGDCSDKDDRCMMVIDKLKFDCECQGCHKVYEGYDLTKTEFVKNVDNVIVGELINLNTWANIDVGQFRPALPEVWDCQGPCPDTKECVKQGEECMCKVKDAGDLPHPTSCADISPSGDGEWWKCLEGYCTQMPYCSGTDDAKGWYMDDKLLKLDNDCEGCFAYCDGIGTRSEGWWDSCDRSLITYDICSAKQTCFYNTWKNSCECTGYTDDCAWRLDWNYMEGLLTDQNHPDRYCMGDCPEDTIEVVADVCIGVDIRDVGRVCDCVDDDEVYDNGDNQDTDMDDDGVPDNEDLCPDTAGSESNKGCPEITIDIEPINKLPVSGDWFSRLSAWIR